MHWRAIIVFGIVSTDFFANARNVGVFFHVTDFHLDTNYSQYGNLRKWCHMFSDAHKGPDIGQFGNYTCDAPFSLVNATVYGMMGVQPSPDFIIWTGDSLPHVNNTAYNMDGQS